MIYFNYENISCYEWEVVEDRLFDVSSRKVDLKCKL